MSLTRRGLILLVGAVCAAASVVVAPPAFAAAPTVTSFAPTSGPIGTTVTVTGTGFTAPVKVTFGTVASKTVKVVSATKVTAVVPPAAASGPLTVSTGGGAVTSSASFTVTPGLTLDPAIGPPTTSTAVAFGGFGAFEAVDLYVDTTDVALVSADANGTASATVVIPASAAPGTHWVTAVGRHSGYSAQASFLVRTDWAQLGDGATHRGLNPYENQISAATAGNLTEEWRVTGHESSLGGRATPAVVAGVVYTAFGEGSVVAADAATGAVKWTDTLGSAVQSSPAVSGGMVFVGSDNDFFYALNAKTGHIVWQAQTGDVVEGAPVVAGNTVYVGSFDHRVYAFDTATGAVRWTYITNNAVLGSPAVLNGVVYATSVDGGVYALDSTDGSLLWNFQTGAPIDSSAVVVNGRVYVASNDKTVYSLRATTGLQLWARATGGDIEGGPAVASGRVYVSSDDGSYYVFDAGSGNPVSTTPLSTGSIRSTPTWANGLVYVGIGPFTDILSGASVVATIPVSTTNGNVVVVDGAVYLNDFNSGELVRYDLGVGPLAVHAPTAGSLHPDRSLRAS